MSKETPYAVIIDTETLTLHEFDTIEDIGHYRTDIIKIVPSKEWYEHLNHILKQTRKIREILNDGISDHYQKATWLTSNVQHTVPGRFSKDYNYEEN